MADGRAKNGGARTRAGRKQRQAELAYLDAVKSGAPKKVVKQATEAVLRRAINTGDPKAYAAVLQFLVPTLERREINKGFDDDTRELLTRFYATIAERKASNLGETSVHTDSTGTTGT